MADDLRYLRDTDTGFVEVVEGLDGATPILTVALNTDNGAAATSVDTDDFFLMFVDGVPKKVTVENALAAKTYVVERSVKFDGELVEATGAANWQATQKRIPGEPGMTNTVVGIAVVGCAGLLMKGGSTTVKVSNYDYAGQLTAGAESAIATVQQTEAYSARTLCSIESVGTPPYFYIFIPTTPTGGHQGLDVHVYIEVSPL